MKKARYLLGLLLAAVFLYLFLRNIELQQVWTVISRGNPYWLLACLFLSVFNYYVRALRWRYFFLPIKKTKIWNLFTTTVIGFATNTLLPAKIGEMVRPYLLGTKENIGRSAALATVVVERMFDSLSILLLLVVYLFFLVDARQLKPEAASLLDDLSKAGLIVFLGIIALTIFLYYLKSKPVLLKKLFNKLDAVLPARFAHSLEGILDSFTEGLSILHDGKILITISYWSILFWILICAGVWAGVRAYVPDFPFTGTFLIMILLAIGIAVPTPGAVGSYHFACKISLTRFFGVPDAEAAAVALVTHFLAFVPITILGTIFIWREGLTA
ncbi:MAG TPA: lysylphosphatidylglycerol synthase transmembrane domain-containing protein, partial [Acidobacteriota bacterium]